MTGPIETDSSGEAQPLAELLANDLEVSRHCYDMAQQNDPDRTGDLLRAPVYFALADLQKALRRTGIQVADPVFASATEACVNGASAYVNGKSRP